jgi:cysteinyl-tRNA synthetase, unknown class
MKLLRLVVGLAAVLGAATYTLASMPGSTPARLAARTGPPLPSAKVWGYQLQGAQAENIAADIDLIVIDHARESTATQLLSAADVAKFRNRPGREPRIVLAYMSIGEAERYRYYWRGTWTSNAYFGWQKPAWLARENKDWKGNYLVRYWDPEWQRVIVDPAPSLLQTLRTSWLQATPFGQPTAYLDKILQAGFDGVYLDRVDAFSEWEKTRPTAEAEMSAFVQQLSAYAKTHKPGFLIVPQNGEELAANKDYRRVIDGIAKEDLLFGVETQEAPNDRDETKRSIELLQKVKREGKPVFVVEYLRDRKKREFAQARTAETGFIVTFAERELNRPPELLPPTSPPAQPPSAVKSPSPAIPKPQL